MFLFALPAGALADIIDKRRFVIVLGGSNRHIFGYVRFSGFDPIVTPTILLTLSCF